MKNVLGALALACQGSKAKAPGSATNPRREAAVVKSSRPVRAGTRTARPVTRNDRASLTLLGEGHLAQPSRKTASWHLPVLDTQLSWAPGTTQEKRVLSPTNDG